MGRYYHGDIEGKFWFAVQESDDASFFGATGYVPDELHYYFNKNHIPEIRQGLDECLQNLDSKRDKLDNFFQKGIPFNDEMISEHLKVKKEDVKEILRWYARLELGKKILDCVEEQGSCSFVAEL